MKFYVVRSERWDFNLCWFWASYVCTSMLRLYLSRSLHFYSDWLWPYCGQNVDILDHLPTSSCKRSLWTTPYTVQCVQCLQLRNFRFYFQCFTVTKFFVMLNFSQNCKVAAIFWFTSIYCFIWQIFLQCRLVWITDYRHTMAKSLILCSLNSNPKPPVLYTVGL